MLLPNAESGRLISSWGPPRGPPPKPPEGVRSRRGKERDSERSRGSRQPCRQRAEMRKKIVQKQQKDPEMNFRRMHNGFVEVSEFLL